MKKNTQLYINPIYDCDYGYQIGYEIAQADGLTEAIFYGGENNRRTLKQALTAAEAECDRLNAEYRKEREIRNEIIEIDKALNKEILNHAHAFLTRKEQSND